MGDNTCGVGLRLSPASEHQGPGRRVCGLKYGSPAEKCGKIRTGDTLVRVDGNPVDGFSPLVLLGQPGTPVQMDFLRDTTEFSVCLVRSVPPLARAGSENAKPAYLRKPKCGSNPKLGGGCSIASMYAGLE
mmetsp:Transcript_27446/g.56247  ORF Transcript_27446/g.56247 Transcript_27446/m.56247 type:complete len:131 (-) Transcript_27446:237-629(-)|eukprot:CAMPEP_0181297606 /NCGR_PEP_ID=MMETSP1101-20121128/5329_1 /TAXON_ID=46948 /ORGANISM="Rhodomonas abbreviata, Strain Caron Lab Isolate" /LENGTH=130 /DNA_ID=CAMNT_0023402553 /DNA_START=287 /DNA_END=679 /DNA_ORIENTATION=+